MWWIVGVILWGLVWGYATKTVNESKGYDGGFWLGFLLGFIGLIIVACKPTNYVSYETAEEAEEMEGDSDKLTIANGGWKCACGRVNADYIGTCACGRTKGEIKAAQEAAQRAIQEENIKRQQKIEKEVSERELLNIQKLKAYKELLDSGVISQEEFDKKKAELLKTIS